MFSFISKTNYIYLKICDENDLNIISKYMESEMKVPTLMCVCTIGNC